MSNETPRPKTLRDSLAAAAQVESSRDSSREVVGGFESGVAWLGRLALVAVAVIPPWMIGAVRFQPQWLMSVGLLVGLGFWWIELALRRTKTTTVVPYVFWLVAGGLALGILQTWQMPEGLAKWMLGRQTELYQTYFGPLVGAERAVPLTASLNVEATWGQIRLMFLGAMGLILGCHFFRRPKDFAFLLSAVTINGVALSIFGLLHRFTDNGKLYWVIELSQGGQAFGPFVNRNNAAGYLLMCLAAAIGLLVYLWQHRTDRGPDIIVSQEIPFWRQIQEHMQIQLAELTTPKLAVLLSIVLMASAVVATLSRGGVTALFTGFVVTLIFYGMARKPKLGALIVLPILVGVGVLTYWVGFNDVLIERFEGVANTEEFVESEIRIRTWGESSQSLREMGLLGAGLGSYPIVQRLYSSKADPGTFEYAENQFVQALVDGGFIALLLLVVAVAVFSISTLFLLNRGNSPSSVAAGTLGVFLASSQVIASVFDFGWYIPANTLLLAILVGVCSQYIHAFAGRLKKKSWLRFQSPSYATHLLVLASFSLCVMVSISYFRLAKVEKHLRVRLPAIDPEKLDLSATESKLKTLTALGGRSSTSTELKYVGDLWCHRARLMVYREMPTINRQSFWEQTDLMRLFEHVVALRAERGQGLANEFMRQPFVIECLPQAARYYRESLAKNPMQADVLMRLAIIMGIYGENDQAELLAKQAVRLQPNDVDFNVATSCLLLFAGKRDESLPYLRQVLELNPQQFVRLLNFVLGLTGRLSQPISNQILAEQVLPDNPKVLFEFVRRYLPKNSPLREDLLRRGVDLIGDTAYVDYSVLLLKINMLLEMQDFEQGVDMLKIAVDTKPTDRNIRYRYATLLLQLEKTDEAMKQARRLMSEEDSPKHKKLYDDVQKLIERRFRELN